MAILMSLCVSTNLPPQNSLCNCFPVELLSQEKPEELKVFQHSVPDLCPTLRRDAERKTYLLFPLRFDCMTEVFITSRAWHMPPSRPLAIASEQCRCGERARYSRWRWAAVRAAVEAFMCTVNAVTVSRPGAWWKTLKRSAAAITLFATCKAVIPFHRALWWCGWFSEIISLYVHQHVSHTHEHTHTHTELQDAWMCSFAAPWSYRKLLVDVDVGCSSPSTSQACRRVYGKWGGASWHLKRRGVSEIK